MPTQAQIEEEVGITDDRIAAHISRAETPAAKTAHDLLRMQVSFCEAGGMALLQQAVEDCKKELEREQTEEPEGR